MTLNGITELILPYFTEFDSFRGALLKIKVAEDVTVESSRSLSDLLMSFLFISVPLTSTKWIMPELKRCMRQFCANRK